jgi:hypothetical protein
MSESPLTLRDFPARFSPIVVVTGDRREERPKTKGDLLAYSVSAIDLTFILSLNLKDVQIVSDKVFVHQDEEWLQSHFGRTHILSIGSPAVNLLSRKINDESVFSFDIPETAKRDMELHEKAIDGFRFDRMDLFLYQQMFKYGLGPEAIRKLHLLHYERADEEALFERCRRLFDTFNGLGLHEKNWSQFMHNFDRPGILDPMDARKHASALTPSNDFGLISMAPNPYQKGKGYHVVLVAGIHGMATARGVKLLAGKGNFDERPLGGVFEVLFPIHDADWQQMLRQAQVKWQTKPYSDRVTSFDDAPNRKAQSSGGAKREDIVFLSMRLHEGASRSRGEKKAAQIAGVIENALKPKYRSLECIHPYDPRLDGTWNYVEGILQWFPRALFVVHDITDLSPGVMFEIGCSYGLNKKPLLLVDSSSRKTSFSLEGLPQLLKRTNVRAVDLGRPADREALAAAVRDIAQRAVTAPKFAPPDPKKVFIMMNGRWARQRTLAMELVARRGLTPVVEEDHSDLDRVRRNIESCAMTIIDVTGPDAESSDLDGLVALGVARARQRKVLQLAHQTSGRPSSMFDGRTVRWHEENFPTALGDGLNNIDRVDGREVRESRRSGLSARPSGGRASTPGATARKTRPKRSGG